MQPQITVREAAEGDVPGIVDVYIRAYAEPPWLERHEAIASEGYLRWVMGQPGTSCLVSGTAPLTRGDSVGAVDGSSGGAVEGFVLAGPRGYADFLRDWERLADRPQAGWPPIPGRLGYIWEIAVLPEAQRRGHGTALLRGAVDRLAAAGVDSVVLRSSERAVAAVSLYRRFGFRRLPVS